MNSIKSLITTTASLLVFSSVSFASFQSDYASFIMEFGKHVPTPSSFSPTTVSGSLSMTYEYSGDNSMMINGMLGFQGQRQTTTDALQVNVSLSGWYTDASGRQYLDTAMKTIIIPSTGDVTDVYVTLDRVVSNIPMLQETGVQLMIAKLTTNWYVRSGETSRLDPTMVVGSPAAISPTSIDPDTMVKLYTHLTKYPVFTPTNPGATAHNGVYNISLNKRNMSRTMGMLSQMQDPEISISTKNQIVRDSFKSMKWLKTSGTFDTTKQKVTLLTTQNDTNAVMVFTPRSLDMLMIDDNQGRVNLATAWDSTMARIVFSGTMEDTTFQGSMNVNQSSFTLDGSYSNSSSKGNMNANVILSSGDVVVTKPATALPIADLEATAQ
jgi:hypothetical protein